jgi:hypothetical protein
MKRTLKTAITGAIALAFAAPLAIAAPGEDGERKGSRGGGDREGRGGDRPSREEMAAKREEMMKKFDKDGDGKLNIDERVAMLKERLKEDERFKEMFTKRADTDKDGTISDAELKAAAEKFGQRGPRGGGDRAGRGPRGGGDSDAPGKGGKKPRPETEL